MVRVRLLLLAALVAAVAVPVAAFGSLKHEVDSRVSQGNDAAHAGNGAFAAVPQALTDDGVAAVFSTAEPLVAADTDGLDDLYLRSGTQTVLLTPGQSLGSGPEFVAGSVRALPGGRVLFASTSQLGTEVDDATVDVFVASSAGAVTQLTDGTQNDATNWVTSPDGTWLAFATNDKTYRVPVAGGTPTLVTQVSSSGVPVAVSNSGAVLVQTFLDLYRFDAPAPSGTLITPGMTSQAATYLGSTPDLSTVAFSTDEGLIAADTNAVADAYAITGPAAGGTLTRLSRPGAGVVGVSAAPGGESTPCVGSDTILVTSDRLAAGDQDSQPDVYRVPVAGDPMLLSGTDSATPTVPFTTADCSKLVISTVSPLAVGNNGTPAQYLVSGTTAFLVGNSSSFFGATPDGASVFVNSDTRISSEDENNAGDAFVWTAGVRKLITRGGFTSAGETGAFASADGSVVLVATADKLGDGDTDAVSDVYRYKRIEVADPPTPTPVPSVGPTVTPEPSASPTATVSPSATPTARPGDAPALTAPASPSVHRVHGRVVIDTGVRVRCRAGCTLRVRGAGRKHGHTVKLGATKTKVRGSSKPAAAQLVLSRGALKRLRAAGRLKVTFTVVVAHGGKAKRRRVHARIRAPAG